MEHAVERQHPAHHPDRLDAAIFQTAGSRRDQASPAGEAKSIVATKSAREVTPPSDLKGLPGHYWFGAYWSPWEFPQFGTTANATNSYGFYWHADQMIFQEAPGSDQGLSLWSAFVLSPQQNIAKLPFQVNGGLIYRGLIPTRDADYGCFAVVYGKFSATTPGRSPPPERVIRITNSSSNGTTRSS